MSDANTAHVVSENLTDQMFADARKGRLGSSQIASVVGLGYDTPLKLWCKMTGRLAWEEGSDKMLAGKIMEPSIATLFGIKTKYTPRRCQSTFGRASQPWAIATPDYLYTRGGQDWILELKNTGEWSRSKWEDGNTPDYAHCQVIWQMGVTNIHRSTVAALIGGSDLVTRDVEFSQPVFDQLVEAGDKFLQLVKADTPPEAMPEDLDVIHKVYGYDPSKVVVAGHLEALCYDWKKHDDARKVHQKLADAEEEKRNAVRAKIQAEMKGAAAAICGGMVVEVKEQVVNHKAKEAHQTSYMKFKIREKEDGRE
jgi:putative phage-type endonuclease